MVAIFRVEVARGFVGENDIRLVNKSAGQRQALLFPAGELDGIVMQAITKADGAQQVGGLFRRAGGVVQFRREHNIF